MELLRIPQTPIIRIVIAQRLLIPLHINPLIHLRHRERHRRVIQQIPLRGVPPVLSRVVFRRDARTHGTQHRIDTQLVPVQRVLLAIRLALLKPVRELAHIELLHARVLRDDPLGERTPGLARGIDGLPVCLAAVGEVQRCDDGPRLLVQVGLEIHDLDAMPLHALHHHLHRAGNRRVRPHNLVVPQDADSQRAIGGDAVFPPGERQQRGLGEPRLRVDDRLHEVLESWERRRHGAQHRLDRVRAGHDVAPAVGGDAEGGGLEAVDAAVCGWAADGATDVGADAETGAVEGEEGAFTAGTATGGEVAVVGVCCDAVEIGVCLEVHHGLGDGSSAVEDGAGSAEDGDEVRVFFCDVVPVGYVAGGAAEPFEAYVFLDADGQAVERANGPFVLLEVGIEFPGSG